MLKTVRNSLIDSVSSLQPEVLLFDKLPHTLGIVHPDISSVIDQSL